jgi:hypothetical protein
LYPYDPDTPYDWFLMFFYRTVLRPIYLLSTSQMSNSLLEMVVRCFCKCLFRVVVCDRLQYIIFPVVHQYTKLECNQHIYGSSKCWKMLKLTQKTNLHIFQKSAFFFLTKRPFQQIIFPFILFINCIGIISYVSVTQIPHMIDF